MLLEWMGVVTNMDFTNACVTDDLKDSQAHQEAMTDDSKANTDPVTYQLQEGEAGAYQPIMMREFGHMVLDEPRLSLLGSACQSPQALKHLLDSEFVAVLCQGLYEFCIHEMSRFGEPVVISEMFSDSRGSSGPTSPRGGSVSSSRGTKQRHESGSSQTGGREDGRNESRPR